jgi:hypothetical protein
MPGTKATGKVKMKWVYYRILILTFPVLTLVEETSPHVGFAGVAA